MNRAIVTAVVALAVAGCASAPAGDPNAPRIVNGFGLAAYAIHEECRSLAPGDRLDYSFSSTAPVAFNIHYHDSNAVLMPIARDAVTADSGIFQPVVRQEYCLMWEARAAPVTLDYRIAVRRRSP